MEFFTRNRKYLIAIIVIAVMLGGYFGFTSNNKSNVAEPKTSESGTLSNEDIITDNNLKIIIGNLTSHKYEGEDKKSKSKNTELIIVPIEITNLGESDTTVGAIDFKLKLDDKKDIFVDANREAFVVDVKPDQTIKKKLFFKADKSKKVSELIYNSDIDKSIAIPIK